ncbi:MAG: hypothetical protein OZSIB_4102 [Candidatus Ozemobacter sibiricus]|uniref:Uncharacterized protein n=1 Tax=Candidatus Ozemobacter sibiricus TaxID=2268124 RepID=A0A367ZNK6_9BACT|nr:MAG: hypothetical protein OZSIB_4102 [Candidatus Ozemobacter sibiricus]
MALAKILNPMTSPADRVRIAAEFGIDLAKYGIDKSGNLIKAGKQIGEKVGSAISNAGSQAKDAVGTVGGKIVKPIGKAIEKVNEVPNPGKAVIQGAKTTIKNIFDKDGQRPQEPVTTETTAGSAMNE